jgi:hypothetical protein
MTVDDNELPGMWASADFTGGDPDERSYAERERRVARKTPGLIGLERFVDTALTGARDGIGIYEAMGVIEDLTEKAICDLGDSGREGMKLLVRVALAAREWDKASNGLGSIFEAEPFAGLRRCVKALDEWERSL